MEIEEVNEKGHEYNSMESCKMTHYIKPVVFIKKTINGVIENRIVYEGSEVEISEAEASSILNNFDAIDKIVVTNMTDENYELRKLTNTIRNKGRMGSIIKELPMLIIINREYANDWENFIGLGYTKYLNEFVSKVSKEINSHDTSATSDVISFWGYALYLLTDRRVITNEEIAKLNKELEGGVGDIIFGR